MFILQLFIILPVRFSDAICKRAGTTDRQVQSIMAAAILCFHFRLPNGSFSVLQLPELTLRL